MISRAGCHGPKWKYTCVPFSISYMCKRYILIIGWYFLCLVTFGCLKYIRIRYTGIITHFPLNSLFSKLATFCTFRYISNAHQKTSSIWSRTSDFPYLWLFGLWFKYAFLKFNRRNQGFYYQNVSKGSFLQVIINMKKPFLKTRPFKATTWNSMEMFWHQSCACLCWNCRSRIRNKWERRLK